MNLSFKKSHAFKCNKPEFFYRKAAYFKNLLIFQKIRKPPYRGDLGLLNGLLFSRIDYFLFEKWPKEWPQLLNRPISAISLSLKPKFNHKSIINPPI